MTMTALCIYMKICFELIFAYFIGQVPESELETARVPSITPLRQELPGTR